MQLYCEDDDKIGSRIYFSEEVSQLQERPQFVTRLQNFKFKNNPLYSAASKRGVRLHVPHPGGQPLYSVLEVETV